MPLTLCKLKKGVSNSLFRIPELSRNHNTRPCIFSFWTYSDFHKLHWSVILSVAFSRNWKSFTLLVWLLPVRKIYHFHLHQCKIILSSKLESKYSQGRHRARSSIPDPLVSFWGKQFQPFSMPTGSFQENSFYLSSFFNQAAFRCTSSSSGFVEQ